MVARIVAASPLLGPIRGGTTISIQGAFLVHLLHDSGLTCEFESILAADLTARAASRRVITSVSVMAVTPTPPDAPSDYTSNHVTCRTPHANSVVAVSTAGDLVSATLTLRSGGAVIDGAISFVFYPDPVRAPSAPSE